MLLGTRAIDPVSVHMTVLGDSSDHSVYDARDARHTVIVWADTPNGQRLATSWVFYPSQQEKERQAMIRKRLLDLPLHHAES